MSKRLVIKVLNVLNIKNTFKNLSRNKKMKLSAISENNLLIYVVLRTQKRKDKIPL